MKNDDKGSALMIAILFTAMLTILAGSYLDLITNVSSGTQFVDKSSQAFYAAEAGVHRLLDQMNNGGASSVSGTLVNASSTSSYTASYDSTLDVITSTSSVATTAGTATRTVSARAKAIPSFVRAAISCEGDATVKNKAVLDGRDHDSDGNLTGGAGTYGLSSTGKVKQQKGDANIGGNGNAPDDPAAASAIQQNATGFSSTDPWDILGVTKAWFDKNVTNTTTPPKTPFSGIVYYTPNSKKPWKNPDLAGSTGILIVHNDESNATLKNFTGTFKGLIIADKLTEKGKADGEVIGAVIVANKDKKLGGELSIKYSSSVLASLSTLMGGQTSQWKKIISSGSWTENQ